MPGTASRARTPLSTARLYAASLPDGNSNVIEISASAKSHLQRERENPLLQPRPFPALSLQCWKPQHCCFYYYIFFYPLLISLPLSTPDSFVFAAWSLFGRLVKYMYLWHIYAMLAIYRFSLTVAVNWSRSVVCVCVICHMGPGSTTRILISLAQLMVMLAKCINGI